ncbi:uncharacterized protein LOC110239909 [Exaiptasia diaphana]|uniref:DDE Tnp4 domain-containing protein n=1 Tax=Exaiptasia diaphana TaxID=2652724 RepID=A0A913YLH7_EXADI|nr:uncharacterized protein LOC110239909 [Exaiptasia diaphana]
MDDQELQAFLLNVIAILLLFTAIQPPIYEEAILPLNRRLMPNFHGHGFNGRDVYTMISSQPWLFWRNTGETLHSFQQLVTDLSPILIRQTVHGQPRVRQRRQIINFANQILLVLMWLRKYLHVDNLALWFNIDPASVVRIIYKVVPEFWQYFQNQISWPNLQEWNNLAGNWPEFPHVVGAIDSTPHEIYRPITEPQRLFYSGHRHYHCIHTQLVIDNQGNLRFVQAGFLGSTHDATSYRLMTPIGPGRPLALPPGLKLLADKAYPDGGPLITTVRANQVFKEIKTYKCISTIWRHPRWLLPPVVELVAFLAERRVKLFESI